MGPELSEIGFGRNDYICADNVAKKLYVRSTNEALTSKKGPIETIIPYFVKK